jgi:hypothetical protein
MHRGGRRAEQGKAGEEEARDRNEEEEGHGDAPERAR